MLNRSKDPACMWVAIAFVSQASMQRQWCNRRSTGKKPFPFVSKEAILKGKDAQSKLVFNK